MSTAGNGADTYAMSITLEEALEARTHGAEPPLRLALKPVTPGGVWGIYRHRYEDGTSALVAYSHHDGDLDPGAHYHAGAHVEAYLGAVVPHEWRLPEFIPWAPEPEEVGEPLTLADALSALLHGFGGEPLHEFLGTPKATGTWGIYAPDDVPGDLWALFLGKDALDPNLSDAWRTYTGSGPCLGAVYVSKSLYGQPYVQVLPFQPTLP